MYRLIEPVLRNDQNLIRELLVTIISGQIFDLREIPRRNQRDVTDWPMMASWIITPIWSPVAVGEFWTRICAAHLPRLSSWNVPKMCELGIRSSGAATGNVLRDVAWDCAAGAVTCRSTAAGIARPSQLRIDPRRVHEWLDRAVEHLESGVAVRDADSAGPVAGAAGLRLADLDRIENIARLREANPLDPSRRVKVSRMECTK